MSNLHQRTPTKDIVDTSLEIKLDIATETCSRFGYFQKLPAHLATSFYTTNKIIDLLKITFEDRIISTCLCD